MTLGVLLMAYGSPATLDDVEAYYTHIRGGRTPAPEQVEALKARYRRIGGRSPLLEITQRQAEALQAALEVRDLPARVYVGMKHAPPFITETVARMAGDGIRTALAVALAPHYSRISIGSYCHAATDAAQRHGVTMRYVQTWHDHPGLIAALTASIQDARRRARGSDLPVVFTAHSLPVRILQWQDPYPDELRRTCELVAGAAGITQWRFAYQSASHTAEPWLGPDLLEVLRGVHAAGSHEVIVCPVGFVADHLEVLYDIDVEAQALAGALGLRLVRAPSLNDRPDFIQTLAALVLAGVSHQVTR